MIQWNNAEQLKDPIAIDAIEAGYGITIPAELKKLIIEHNGGFPTPNRCIIRDNMERDVKMLLSYNNDDPETIFDVIDYFMKRSHRLILPFASDSGDGYYCLKGSFVVYVEGEDMTPITVAESFSKFWELLF